MSDFILLTRVYENQRTGEREQYPLLVNLDHVRSFRPKNFPVDVRGSGAWITWNAPGDVDSEVVEDFEDIAGHQFGITVRRAGGPT